MGMGMDMGTGTGIAISVAIAIGRGTGMGIAIATGPQKLKVFTHYLINSLFWGRPYQKYVLLSFLVVWGEATIFFLFVGVNQFNQITPI